MWLITTRGMVSAVEWQGGEHDGKIVVRARTRDHLEKVLDLCPNGACTAVAVSPAADYRYRAWVTRDGFDALVVALAHEITYRNFKGAVERQFGRNRYEAALHSVWSTLARLQPGGPYGTGGSSYPPIPKGEPRRKKLSALKVKVSKAVRSETYECVECGHRGPGARFELIGGEPFCLDIPACLARTPRLFR